MHARSYATMDDPIDAYEVEGLNDNEIKLESDDELDIDSDDIKSEIDFEGNDIDEPNTKRNRTKRQAQFTVKHSGWTREDKLLLFNGLMENGSADIKYLTNRIQTKSPKAIREYIANLERHARSALKQGKGRVKTERKAPIDQWLHLIIKSSHSESFKHKDFARAIKYVALFEQKTGSADVRIGPCYEVLSNLFSGDAPRQLSQDNSVFLLKNVQKLASLMKDLKHNAEEEFFNKPPKKSGLKIYKNKKKLEEVAELEESFLHFEGINPLKIPKHLLGSS